MIASQEKTKYCLDTNFIIAFLDGNDNAALVYEEIKDAPLAITAIASVALFEILRGKEQNQDKIQKFEELRHKLEILPFGEKEAEEAGQKEKGVWGKAPKESIASYGVNWAGFNPQNPLDFVQNGFGFRPTNTTKLN